jgi:hypothetical protein
MARPTTPVEFIARRSMGAMRRTVDLELGVARSGLRAVDRVMARTAGVLARVTDRVEGVRPLVLDQRTAAGHPMLAVDDLAVRDEWDGGRCALGSFLADCGIDADRWPACRSDPARWDLGDAMTEVGLVYGTPVIELTSDGGSAALAMSTASRERLGAAHTHVGRLAHL